MEKHGSGGTHRHWRRGSNGRSRSSRLVEPKNISKSEAWQHGSSTAGRAPEQQQELKVAARLGDYESRA
jgi:Ni/Co efflux regulator RcnB